MGFVFRLYFCCFTLTSWSQNTAEINSLIDNIFFGTKIAYAQQVEMSDMVKVRSNLLYLDSVLYTSDTLSSISGNVFLTLTQKINELELITGIKSTSSHDYLGVKDFNNKDYTKWLLWYVKNVQVTDRKIERRNKKR